MYTLDEKNLYSFNIKARSIDKFNEIYGFQDKSNRTKQWIANMKMNGIVVSVDWFNNS
ncbi:hypothetical protein C2G38_2175634 [Gigaspora rosea]|uniref:Uncharacterized protein n=1 Tax=Gigaspora rosea TaxID=44941 RepID=A0A397VID7_9GLOM|nr:hypothetical protein C2G38_2175634 [Gigaspora rosea]